MPSVRTVHKQMQGKQMKSIVAVAVEHSGSQDHSPQVPWSMAYDIHDKKNTAMGPIKSENEC